METFACLLNNLSGKCWIFLQCLWCCPRCKRWLKIISWRLEHSMYAWTISGVANSIIWGGGHITLILTLTLTLSLTLTLTVTHIFEFTDYENNQFQKEINCAQHEYMNMCPLAPTYRVCYATVNHFRTRGYKIFCFSRLQDN